MYGMKRARVLRVEARRRPVAAEVTDRSPWDWYAQSCPCGLPPGECRASPRPAEPAAPRGRLAGLGVRGRTRGGQDAGRGLLDPAPRRSRHHEARLPDCPDRRRHPRRDGRGPVWPDRHQRAGRSTPLSRQDRLRAARPGRVGSIVTRAGGLLRVRAGVRLAVRRPVAAPPGFGRARDPRPAAGKRRPLDPPAVLAAEGRLPDVHSKREDDRFATPSKSVERRGSAS